MPSKREGFGIVFLEALLHGLPVIAGNKDGSADPLLDGKIGLLIDPDNLKGISEAILSILEKNIDNRLIDSKFLKEADFDSPVVSLVGNREF